MHDRGAGVRVLVCDQAGIAVEDDSLGRAFVSLGLRELPNVGSDTAVHSCCNKPTALSATDDT